MHRRSRRRSTLKPSAPRRLVIAGLALTAVAALPGLARLSVDNSPERFFVRDSSALRQQEAFEALFGDQRRLWVVLRGEVWTRPGLEALARVERAVAETPGVSTTGGLWSRHRWIAPEWPPSDLDGFHARALTDPLVAAAGWISDAGTVAAIAVEISARASAGEIDALERNARQAAGSAFEVGLAGLPVFERAMDASQRRLVLFYLPALLVLATLLLWRGFGSLRAAWPPLALVAIVVGPTLGAIGYLNEPLDMISVIFVPILFVVVLASAVHLQAGLNHRLDQGLTPRRAVAGTLRRKGRAVVWTSLTTAVAFGSFTLSPLGPVRAIGFWLAAGLGWMLLNLFGLYPVLLERRARAAWALSSSERPSRSLDGWLRGRAPRCARWIRRRRIAVLSGFSLLTLAALAGAARLESDSNLLSYFSASHPARAAVSVLETAGLAAASAEVLIRLPADTRLERRFRDPDQLDRLAALGSELRRLSIPSKQVGVRGAIGAGELFRAALADVVLDGSPGSSVRWLVLGMLQADPDAAARLGAFLADEGRAARLSVLLPLRDPRQLDPLLEEVRASAQRAFPEARVAIQGELPLLLAAQRHLLETLSMSLLLTLMAVVVILALVVRSAAGTVRALLPNLWAVIAVFGIMGWTGVPLDSTTVMIAAIVLGLAVDDTLHTLAEVRAGRSGAEGQAETPQRVRLSAVFERVASAHVLTSLVLITGFAVCALSDSLLLARFGAVTAGGVVAALAADLLLFPALLAGDVSRGQGS